MTSSLNTLITVSSLVNEELPSAEGCGYDRLSFDHFTAFAAVAVQTVTRTRV